MQVYINKKYADLYNKEVYQFKHEKLCKHKVNQFLTKTYMQKFDLLMIRDKDKIITPYGYGGYQSDSYHPEFIYDAIEANKKRCLSLGINKEVIKWSPFQSIKPFDDVYKFDIVELNRYLAVKNLTKELFDDYSSTTKNILRKTDNYTFRESKNLTMFMKLYYKTMSKNEASDFYYFNEEYFKKLMKIKNVKLYEVMYNKHTISMGFFFMHKPYASYHLSANVPHSSLNGNYHLLNGAFNVAKNMGCTHMLLGGGRTTDKNDSLLQFKKKFTKTLLPFYITERWW